MKRTEDKTRTEDKAGRPPPPQHKRLSGQLKSVAGRPEKLFAGIPVSPGVAIGPVFGTSEPPAEIIRQKVAAADIEAERARPGSYFR